MVSSLALAMAIRKSTALVISSSPPLVALLLVLSSMALAPCPVAVLPAQATAEALEISSPEAFWLPVPRSSMTERAQGAADRRLTAMAALPERESEARALPTLPGTVSPLWELG